MHYNKKIYIAITVIVLLCICTAIFIIANHQQTGKNQVNENTEETLEDILADYEYGTDEYFEVRQQALDENPLLAYRDESDAVNYIAAEYKNIARTLHTSDGCAIRIGKTSSDNDKLYLQAEYFCGTADSVYGIYLKSDYGYISYPEIDYCDLDTIYKSTGNCFVICDRTYDTLIPADAEIKWEDKYFSESSVPVADTIHIRVVDFSTMNIVAVAAVDVVYTDNMYRLSNFRNTNTDETKIISTEQKDQFIQQALDFLTDPGIGPDLSEIYSEELYDYAFKNSLVENIDGIYFDSALDSNNAYVTSVQVRDISFYAVNIATPGYGNITVYIATDLQIKGYTVSADDLWWREGDTYEPACYDFLNPISKTDLVVPSEVEQYFYK